MREGWQGAGGLPEMAGGTAFALDLFGQGDATAQGASGAIPGAGGASAERIRAGAGTGMSALGAGDAAGGMLPAAQRNSLDLFGAAEGSMEAANGASGLSEMAGGTAFALDLFGAGENTAASGVGQGGANSLVGAAALPLAANGLPSAAGSALDGINGPSGTAGVEPSGTNGLSEAADGEFSQTDAANGPGTEANGLPGTAGENGLPGTDAADGAAVPSGQVADASLGGADAGEAAALLRAMRAQYGLPEAGAAELLAAFGQDRSRGQTLRAQAARQAAFRGIMGEYLSMLREADALRQRYPGFSLPELAGDARFAGMLRAGLSMEDAYLAMHGREVLRQAIAATHRWTETQLRAQWAAESRRPTEGAMTGGSTALSRANPAQMSRAQREAIARRVLKGERILL